MRNLKKILALVLTLVMSLSLMATASAKDFTDSSDIEATGYQTAVDVLAELEVVRGYENGSFQPNGDITRAEVAAIIYRIATKDVKDAQQGIYTTWGKFADVKDTAWYAGYVNYCANAEIVKGKTATTFDPEARITGYQVLAMILRTMGYGKNGEFEGPNWAINTAAQAKQIGIIDNILEQKLGSNATRAMVAEILFRALLTSTVTYNAITGYRLTGETLGKTQFGLEKITGVVMANEWASLTGDSVLKEGTTQLRVKNDDDTTRTLTLTAGTDLDAVGLTYDAYIANGEGSTKRALTLTENPVNVVAFNEGEAVGPKGTTLYDENRREASIEDLADEEDLAIVSATEYYIDYDQGWFKSCTSDYQIGYVVNVNMASTTPNSPGVSLDEALASGLVTQGERDYLVALIELASGKKEANFPANFVFSRSIRIGAEIDEVDLAIMEAIFDLAGRYEANNPVVKGYTIGEVYVGTTQTKDYSDEMSWKAFKAEYLIGSKDYVKFTSAEAGESLRVIDNNGDGKAEYVLKITYTLDQVVGTFKDAPELQSFQVARKYKDNNLYQPEELTVGDVVVWNVIDGKLSLWPAEYVTETIKTKTFKNITVTSTTDTTYGQSGITNATGMDELIMNMNEKVEYIMFKDRFGFIRAYTLAAGTQYALLTEMYPSGTQNWNYVRNTEWTAEMKIGDADPAEYRVVNMSGGKYNGSVFASNSVWTKSLRNYYQSEWNYLQPAVAHLGNPQGLAPNYNAGRTLTDNESRYSYFTDTPWNRIVMEMGYANGATNPFGVFTYDTAYSYPYVDDNGKDQVWNEPAFSFTNVATYVMDGDDVTLASATKLAKDTYGNVYYYNTTALTAADTLDGSAYPAYCGCFTTSEWAAKGIKTGLTPVYATDYVQLAKQDVKANTKHYDIHANYGSYYTANSNGYVNATVDTEFYIVTPDRIIYKVGYGDLPTIKASQIRAAYAVANNTTYAANGLDYWVADVIVIEVNRTESDWDSVSAVYYNPFETTGAIRYLNSLNSAWKTWQPESDDKAILDVVPTTVTGGIPGNPSGSQSWGDTSWTMAQYGFYALYATELDDSGDLTVKEAKKITTDWNKYGIYAGTIQRIYQLTGSNYIDVDKEGRTYYGMPLTGAQVEALNVQNIPVYRVTKTSASEIALSAVRYSDVKVGDPIIWVYEKGSTSKIAYIIDLAEVAKVYSTAVGNYPTWLKDDVYRTGDYDYIIAYQKMLGKDELKVTVLTDGAAESAVVASAKTNVSGDVAFSNSGKVTTVTIPDGATVVELTVTTTGLTAADLLLAIDYKWELLSRTDSGNTCTIKLIRKTTLETKASAVTGTPVETLVGDNTILTKDYLTNVIAARVTDLLAQYATADEADKAVIAKELNAIKESLKLLQQPNAVTDAAAQTTVAAQIAAIEDVVGTAADVEGKDAAAEALVEAYTEYQKADAASLLPSVVQKALDTALEAAVAYEPYYTAPTGTPTDAETAYEDLQGMVDTAVKAVYDASDTELTPPATTSTLGNIIAALDAVDDAKEVAKGLDIASWKNADAVGAADLDKAAYTELVEKIEARKNLVTLAANLVTSYNSWKEANDEATLPDNEGTLWTAYANAVAAVTALPVADRNVITLSTATTAVVATAGSTTPADAYAAYNTAKDARPVDAVAKLAVKAAKAAEAKWEPAADGKTGTLTVPTGSSITSSTIDTWLDKASDAVGGGLTFADGTGADSGKIVATVEGLNKGKPAKIVITVIKNSDNLAENAVASLAAKTTGTFTYAGQVLTVPVAAYGNAAGDANSFLKAFAANVADSTEGTLGTWMQNYLQAGTDAKFGAAGDNDGPQVANSTFSTNVKWTAKDGTSNVVTATFTGIYGGDPATMDVEVKCETNANAAETDLAAVVAKISPVDYISGDAGSGGIEDVKNAIKGFFNDAKLGTASEKGAWGSTITVEVKSVTQDAAAEGAGWTAISNDGNAPRLTVVLTVKAVLAVSASGGAAAEETEEVTLHIMFANTHV